MKIVIGDPKTAKAHQFELVKEKEAMLFGKHIGEEIDGSLVGAAGYKLKITGGSDKDGFPMKAGIGGIGKKKVVLSKGVGFSSARPDEMKKKMIRAGSVSDEISQINMVVLEAGPTSLDQIFPKVAKAEGEKKEEKSKGKKR
jgi:small subunit ribosomal protein S6e